MGRKNARAAYQMETFSSWDLDWASSPTTPNASAPQSIHLICPLASRSHRNQLWDAFTHPLIHRVGAPGLARLSNFRRSSTAIFELDPQYLQRQSWLSFPSLCLAICSLHIASHRIQLRSPLSSNSSFRLQLILCSLQTALCLRMGCHVPSRSNKLSLVFLLSSCSTGQRALTNLPSTSPPAGPMRAPDSRPSISV